MEAIQQTPTHFVSVESKDKNEHLQLLFYVTGPIDCDSQMQTPCPWWAIKKVAGSERSNHFFCSWGSTPFCSPCCRMPSVTESKKQY